MRSALEIQSAWVDSGTARLRASAFQIDYRLQFDQDIELFDRDSDEKKTQAARRACVSLQPA
ncbi:hypothetical protein PT2222_80113 [Paraburkholderia tropica]